MRMRDVRAAVLSCAVLAATTTTALGQALQPGAVAPNFTKTLLGGGSASLNTYAGKVRVLFMLGYG